MTDCVMLHVVEANFLTDIYVLMDNIVCKILSIL